MKTLVIGIPVLVACGGNDGGMPPAPDAAPTAALYEPAQRYTPLTGDGMITYTTQDPQTPSRTIRLRVRVPQGATGPLPAVVVMHGGGFADAGHEKLEDWGIALASAGYVAINFANAEDEATSHCVPLGIPLAECNGTAFTTEVADGGTLPAAVWSRPNDAKAILDRLDGIEQAAGVTIDRARLGVLGHSAGAHGVMALAGASIAVSPSVPVMTGVAEPRFKAFVANSPQGIGYLGLSATSWDPIRAPVLIQTGLRDMTPGEEAAGRRHAFQGLDGPDAFEHYVNSEDTQHGVFSLEFNPGIENIELTLATTGVAFFDAYLNDRAEAHAWLASDALTEATAGVSTLARK